MIPRVARGSTSFGEAKDYYLYDKDADVLDRDDTSPMQQAADYALNDKGGARTSYRVGFTETINLDAKAPADAIKEMQERYDDYRAWEQHKRGRKLQKPVYTYSLSWTPDENPTREDMLAAARSSLKAMRLEGLQTLIVQHVDEPQPHIHVIVHRIEADGKRARNIPWDHLRFSRWAEAYEREHGRVLCDQRAQNNARREQGVFVKDERSLPRRAYEAKQRADGRQQPSGPLPAPDKAAGSAVFQRHVAEREELDRVFRANVATSEIAARQALKKTWQTLYVRQTNVLVELRLLGRSGVLERAVFIYRHKPLLEATRSLTKTEIASLCASPKKLERAVRQAHARESAEMGQFEERCVAKAADMVRDEYRVTSRELIARQAAERDLFVARLTVETSPVSIEPERANAPPSTLQVPELRQGELLEPDALRKLLTDLPALHETFAEVATPPPDQKRRRGRGDDFDLDR